MSWLPKQSVLVPFDFSESSLRAIGVAQQLVAKPEDILVLHVVEPLGIAEPGVTWGTVGDADRVEVAAKELDDRLKEAQIEGVKTKVILGNPARSISDIASERKDELIVIPSHGRSGFARFFLGSVTEKVLRLAECEVLVLRSEKEDK